MHWRIRRRFCARREVLVLKNCWREALHSDPEPRWRHILRWKIDNDGISTEHSKEQFNEQFGCYIRTQNKNFSGSISFESRVGIASGFLLFGCHGFWIKVFKELDPEMDDVFIFSLLDRDIKRGEEMWDNNRHKVSQSDEFTIKQIWTKRTKNIWMIRRRDRRMDRASPL